MRKISLVAREADGLLKTIQRQYPLLPAPAVRDALKKRDIKVNGERVGSNVRLMAGDEVVLYTPAEETEIPVVYEDNDCLVVNKPAGLNSDDNSRSGFSLIAWARQRGISGETPELVHRLDNQTSGLMIVAKHGEAALKLKGMLKNHKVIKRYTCLVRGCPQSLSSKKTAWLVKDAENARVAVYSHEVTDGKPIVTEYIVLEEGPVSRLQVTLHTGRTHQIRAHLAFLGHPVLGDEVYGDRETNRRCHARQLKLCATSLGFGPDCPLAGLQNRVFQIEAPF